MVGLKLTDGIQVLIVRRAGCNNVVRSLPVEQFVASMSPASPTCGWTRAAACGGR
jgi:hypothetical protein